MNIWIMRHAEAGFNAKSDGERSLTESGEKAAVKQGVRLAKRLADQNMSLDKIIVSPYLRAQQTLDCLLQGMQAGDFMQSFAKSAVVEVWEGITPAGDPDNVHSYLRFLKEEGARNVLLISHLPLVYDLVLTFTDYRDSVHFYPAVIAEIDWSRNIGEIVAVEKP